MENSDFSASSNRRPTEIQQWIIACVTAPALFVCTILGCLIGSALGTASILFFHYSLGFSKDAACAYGILTGYATFVVALRLMALREDCRRTTGCA